jgi:NAD+ synthetase
MDTKSKIKYLQTYFEDYMKQFDLKSCVIGMSGGVDCALVTALVAPVCQKNKWDLIGVMLPSDTNKVEENTRAADMCHAWCARTYSHSINEPFHDCKSRLGIGNRPSEAIRCGNIKARARMIFLYDYAASERGIVLSTDNYTEFLLGFWTLHGDVGDLGLIQNLWKTEVYELANYISGQLAVQVGSFESNSKYTTPLCLQYQALQACIQAIPTDGLGITDSDMDQLGAKDYYEVDSILERYLKGLEVDMNHPVIKRHLASSYKRDNPHNMKLPKGWR